MKKTFFAFATVSTLALFSCKDKAKEAGGDTATTPAAEQTTPATETKPAANEPKTYKVTFAPDTAYLGKKKEAFVKVKNAKAVALQDPDGKSEGIELTFDIEVTNKAAMGGYNVYLVSSESRLTLDNGNNITQHSGTSVNVEPESTKDLAEVVYKIPAGARPTTLNLFYDGTRVSVSVTLE
ncbi:hypothetical protein [Paraflavitalea speifideaquila]|uniref:hypothetical protein n=1 Tax=Paraflavitalea speifideaquila TaxID=3076558 RepID=UPI0028EAA939|nr:hypothetical protein [Paraflavitalea speifideiaquila]